MSVRDPNNPPEFDTLDESIAHSKQHDRWFRVSMAIVAGGMVLGAIAKMIHGREFSKDDPWIGPILGPLAFLWIMAFMHVFFVMVRIRLSKFTRILCYGFYAAVGVLMAKVFVFDWIASRLP
jgi:hypothetical protein